MQLLREKIIQRKEGEVKGRELAIGRGGDQLHRREMDGLKEKEKKKDRECFPHMQCSSSLYYLPRSARPRQNMAGKRHQTQSAA